MSRLSRRKFIITAGTTVAGSLIINNRTSLSATGAPEVTNATLGFIALTDSAPLIIAKEKGYFDKHGMTGVKVVKQASWPVTRDNLELGSGGGGIDGAHILSPMPYMMTLGTITKNKKPVPMYILARLSTNGQAVSVSNTYKNLKVGLDSKVIKDPLMKSKAAGKQLKFAVTFPGGTHDLWMRYWLAAGGIDPNKDVSVIPVPPPQMVANMKVGNMEAFCVGEPWNAQLVNQKAGFTAFITGQLWKDHPEKAFSMRADWVDKNPKAAKALLKAVMEAQQWCDKPENKAEMCKIISQDKWFKVPVADIIERSQGNIDFGTGQVIKNSPVLMKFWANSASYPYKSHDLWFLTEDIRWGYIPASTDTKALVNKVNREDMWREAAKELKIPAAQIPKTSSRGVETFFDGVKFDPEKPQEYLKNLKIKKV